MKNLKSLQVVALAGVAAVLTGCSSTDSAMNDSSDSHAAYRWVSSGGWVPITDARKMVAFPPGWTPGYFGPVSYETYTMAPPAADADADVTVAADADLDRDSTTVTTTSVESDGDVAVRSTTFHEGLQPGDTFVEAAGADSDGDGTLRRVILYTPFNSTGVGR